MQEKPGVMIYFDMRETLNRLSDRNAGLLFRAILEYGATRKVPKLPDVLFPIWPLIQMRLDIDDERYFRVTQKRRYAVYVRWAKHHEQTPVSFDEWLTTLDRNLDDSELSLS